MYSASAILLLCLISRMRSRNAASFANFSRPRSWSRSVIQPSPIFSRISADSLGLALSSQRRGVTPLVLLLKRSGKKSAKSCIKPVLEKPGVQRGHAVGRATADDSQMRHPHRLLRLLLNQAHPAQAIEITGIARRHLAQEAAVDLVDDLQVPRQQALEHADRPALERLPAAACGWCSRWSRRSVPRPCPTRRPPCRRRCASVPARPGPDGCRSSE